MILSHALIFDLPAPWIARCPRCGQWFKSLAEVAAACPEQPFTEKSMSDTLEKGGIAMLKTLLLLAAFGLALAGCGTSETASHRWAKQLAKTYGESNYVAWTNDKGVEFVLSGCPFLNSDGTVTFTPKPEDEYDPRDSTFRGWRHPTSCTDVAGTRDPQDSEFWRFNLYYVTQLRLYGAIPVSPTFKSDQSMKIGVVGARDACEAVRRPMDKKPRGVAGDETTHMTDPCEGPSYFRRPSLTADEG